MKVCSVLYTSLEIHVLLQHLGLVDVHVHLRHVRQERGNHPRELCSFPGCREKFLGLFRQVIVALAGTVFQHPRHTARRADAGNCRRGNENAMPSCTCESATCTFC